MYSLGAANWLRCPVKTDAPKPFGERSLQLCHGRVRRGKSQAALGDAQGQDERHVLERGKFQLDIRKIFPLWQDQALAQVAQRGCGVPILGDI